MQKNEPFSEIRVSILVLKQHKKVHQLSLFLTFSTTLFLFIDFFMAVMPLFFLICMLSIIILGLLETAAAMRVALDHDLLQSMAKNKGNKHDAFKSLDDSLMKLKLCTSTEVDRDLNERLLASVRLFKQQISYCVLQYLTMIFGFVSSVF